MTDHIFPMWSNRSITSWWKSERGSCQNCYKDDFPSGFSKIKCILNAPTITVKLLFTSLAPFLYDSELLEIVMKAMDHSLVHSLIRSHRPLTRLLRPAPHCLLHSRTPLRLLIRMLAHSFTTKLAEHRNIYFFQFSTDALNHYALVHFVRYKWQWLRSQIRSFDRSID